MTLLKKLEWIKKRLEQKCFINNKIRTYWNWWIKQLREYTSLSGGGW